MPSYAVAASSFATALPSPAADAEHRLRLRTLLVQAFVFLDRIGATPPCLFHGGRWALADTLLAAAATAAQEVVRATGRARPGELPKVRRSHTL